MVEKKKYIIVLIKRGIQSSKSFSVPMEGPSTSGLCCLRLRLCALFTGGNLEQRGQSWFHFVLKVCSMEMEKKIERERGIVISTSDLH